MIADRDHVFLARQSSEMSMKNQHKWSTTLVTEMPQLAVGINECEVGQRVADGECG